MFIVADCATVTNSLTLLRSATSQLQSIITQRFNEALSAEDLASIERFFKLFPLLSMHDSGLEKFSAFLCSKVKQQYLTCMSINVCKLIIKTNKYFFTKIDTNI